MEVDPDLLSRALQELQRLLRSRVEDELGLLWSTEMKEKVIRLEGNLSALRAVLDDAERRQLKQMVERDWLQKVKDAVCDAEDVVDKLGAEALRLKVENKDSMGKKVRNFLSPSNPLAIRFKTAKKMQKLMNQFDDIVKEMYQFNFLVGDVDSRPGPIPETRETHSFLIESDICGRDREKEELIDLLSDSENNKVLSVIPIVGMRGMGKTKLAQSVYNDDRARAHFEIRMWVYVSEVFDLNRLLRTILESLHYRFGSFVSQLSLDYLQTRIRETLSGKRYLLVLDDVWNEDYTNWDRLKACLRCGAVGSKILVTTRSDTVASIMGTLRPHHLGALSEQDSWSLFESLARPHPNFESIGREIAGKCHGVPLAVEALGGMLASTNAREDWENVRSDVWDALRDHGFEVGDVDSPPDLISATRETSSFVIESDIWGRDHEKEELIDLLFNSESNEDLSVIPIVGMRGMGKTTLAQLVYNDDRARAHFEIMMWVYVSEVFDVGRLLQEILQYRFGSFVPPLSLHQLHTRVQETLSGRRYLLVLDDVWNEDYTNWDRLKACLRCGAMGSKILVTTRSDTVASIMGTLRPHHLGALSEQDSWSLFESLARPHPNFVSIGREIAGKCHGVPLAVKALARMLASTNAREDWENVRRSDVWDALRDHGFEVGDVDSPPDLISATRETSSFVIESDIWGRDREKEELIDLLFNSENNEDLSVIPIVGMRGMGKTTLAQLVYNDDRVRAHFEIMTWVYVSEVFDVGRFLQEILQYRFGSFFAPLSLHQLHTHVRETLSGRRYLLVLDDVWNEDYTNWDRLKACLRCGAMGSKILVTTRSDTVASIMGTLRPHHLGALLEQDSWSLFESLARPHPNFVSIGREISGKCHGVPLAVKALARMLASTNAREDWENVRRSDVWDALRDHGFEVGDVDSPPDLISATRETTSFVIESDIWGRDRDKEELIDLLFNSENNEDLSVIPIVGMGGMGKTTLAQLVYNDDRVRYQFHIMMWVYVSEVFDLERLLQEILQSAYRSPAPFYLEHLQTRIQLTLSGKRYLLVLDDVWNEDRGKWFRMKACLRWGAMGSKILVTTRSDTVASIMGTFRPHHLGALSEEDSWSLFESLARPHPNFVSIGREIAGKCHGVPLAVKALARMLASTNAREDWENVRRSDVWDALRDHGGILPALKLSYDHLAPSLKQCFRYCAVFPKGCQIDKNKLVKQWIAHNFIHSDDQGTELLEEEGESYFMGLLTRSFFQVKVGTNDVDVTLFNMHDLVHDLLKYIAAKECVILEGSMQISLRETRHLSLKNCEWAREPENLEALKKCEKMHSMFLCCPIDINVCSSLSCLRVLDLSFAQIKYLPNSIDKLKQLRYLDVSSKWVTKLPETMCNLHCLQTLILLGCPLEKLPKNMKRMISLRHIEFDAAAKDLHLPAGIGELTCLRTLPKFVVGKDSGRGIEELKHLNQLSGDIRIEGLDKIINGDHAHEANLMGKRRLRSLELSWPSIEALANTENKAEEVIENLKPHSNLKKLIVDNYMGLNFPSWMMELSNLVGIKLSHCNGCVHLPPLGQLRFLESLEIKEMNAVEYIVEFDRSHNYPDIFPSLKELYICDMPNLKGWSSSQEDGHGDDWGRERDGQPIYHSLHLITIYNCPNMTQLLKLHLLTALECLKMNGVGCNRIELPLSFSLKEVTLSNMRNLERCSAREADGMDKNDQVIFGSLRTLSISDCPKLICLPALHLPALESLMMSRLSCEKIELHTSQSLKIVSLADMPNLERWSPQKVNDNKQAMFPVLKLEVQACPRMVCLPNFLSPVKEIKMYQASELLLVSVANFTPLAFLSIRGIPGVEYLPKELGPNHANLHTLEISDCPKLMSLSYQLKNLSALKKLTIEGCNDLVLSLSGGLQEQQQSPLLSSLEVLKIVNSCDKETSLPGYGIILNSLRELNIRSCGNLKSLSSVGIKNLTTLIIFDCSGVWSSTKWLGELSSLKNLIASSCPDMNFPESIGNLTSLEKLRIENCRSLTSLPQSMGDLELLRNLTIANCPRVTCFPQGLERLRNLQELSIDRCPDLKRVLCENGRRGEDWPKVARVPNISIDGQDIRVYLSREESSGESEEEGDKRPSFFGRTRFNAKLLLPSCSSSSPP